MPTPLLMENLCELIDACGHAAHRFHACARHARNPRLRAWLYECLRQRARWRAQFRHLLGEEQSGLKSGASTATRLHSQWIAVRCTFRMGHPDALVIDECRRAKHIAITHYLDHLRAPLNARIAALLRGQLLDIRHKLRVLASLRPRPKIVPQNGATVARLPWPRVAASGFLPAPSRPASPPTGGSIRKLFPVIVIPALAESLMLRSCDRHTTQAGKTKSSTSSSDKSAADSGTDSTGSTGSSTSAGNTQRQRLRVTRSAAFERRFSSPVGNADHKDVIALFQRVAEWASGPDVKAFAARGLPSLKLHFSTASMLPTSGSMSINKTKGEERQAVGR
jgi:Domain of unknown function (DUF2383)/Domain of unknown function (DUF4142)